jgi:hypothetical protein
MSAKPVEMTPLVVGVAGAAVLLNTSEDKVRELLAAGLLTEVPNLSTPAKKAIAIVELQRFASVNVGGGRGSLRAVAS